VFVDLPEVEKGHRLPVDTAGRCNRVVSTPASYSRLPGFKSMPKDEVIMNSEQERTEKETVLSLWACDNYEEPVSWSRIEPGAQRSDALPFWLNFLIEEIRRNVGQSCNAVFHTCAWFCYGGHERTRCVERLVQTRDLFKNFVRKSLGKLKR
jgi:hypothetical protein